MKELPRLGQRQASGGSQQQGDAQLLFKLTNMKADHRFVSPIASAAAVKLPVSATAINIAVRCKLSIACTVNCQNNVDSISCFVAFIRNVRADTIRHLTGGTSMTYRSKIAVVFLLGFSLI